MDLHNVGMVQRSNKLCFALETGDKMGILFQIRVQQLDRNVALELRIERFPDLCHATKSQSLLEFIFAQASWMCTHNSIISSSLRTCILAIRDRTWRNVKGCQPLTVVVNLHHTFLHCTRVRVELSEEGMVGLCEQIIEDRQCTGL